jgi:EmrB/QacA subfamily drug resistance transporter
MTESSPAAAEAGFTGALKPAVEVSTRARNEILFAILLGLFLSALDQTIVGTALPRIVSDLRGNDLYTWVVTIYLITSTVTGPIYGKLSDLFGRRPMLMIGVSLFLIGSALSGLSQEMWQLILFRGIQGLGAGAIFPISLAVIGDLFTPAERGKYQGLFGAVFGVSALIGPALGGFLTDRISWHWVFYVNLPLGAITLYIIWRLLPTLKREGARPAIDYLGAAAFTAGIVPVLIGLTNAQKGDWSDPGVWGWIVAGVALLAVFVRIEARAKEPIVPLELFRNRTFSLSMVAVFMASFGFFAAIIFLPIWFQVVQGSSATESGYNLLPFLAGLIISSVASGQIVSRTGRYRWITVGALVFVTAGLMLMTNLRADTPFPALWVWMFITGLGVGPSLAVFTIIVQNAVPMKKLGAATSDLTLFRQVGGTVGLTLGFTIFRSGLTEQIPTQLVAAGVPRQVVSNIPPGSFDASQLTSVGGDPMAWLQQVPQQFRPAIEQLIPNFVQGFHQAISLAIADSFWLGVGAAILAVLATALLVEVPLRTTFGHEHEGQAHGAPASIPVPTRD